MVDRSTKRPTPADAVLHSLMENAEIIRSEYAGDFFLIPADRRLLDSVCEAMAAFEDDEPDDPGEDDDPSGEHDGCEPDHHLLPDGPPDPAGPDEASDGWRVSRLTAAE
jgi:hypothetical protein